MGIYRTDFTGTGEFNLPSIGEHIATVKSITPMESKKGSPMVKFEFDINGYRVYHYCLDTPAQNGKPPIRWMFKKTIEAITAVALPSGPVEIDFLPLIGKKIKVIIKHEDYQGKTQAKVEDVIVPELISPGQTDIFEDDVPFN